MAIYLREINPLDHKQTLENQEFLRDVRGASWFTTQFIALEKHIESHPMSYKNGVVKIRIKKD